MMKKLLAFNCVLCFIYFKICSSDLLEYVLATFIFLKARY